MSRRTRIALAAAVAALSLAVAVAPASAGKTGPNNANAKLCQKGGWDSLFTDTGGTFDNEKECTSYAAQGGTLLNAPPLAGRAACPPSLGSFEVGTGNLLWTCTATLPSLTSDELQSLLDACDTDIAGGQGLIFWNANRVECGLYG